MLIGDTIKICRKILLETGPRYDLLDGDLLMYLLILIGEVTDRHGIPDGLKICSVINALNIHTLTLKQTRRRLNPLLNTTTVTQSVLEYVD